MFWAIYQVLNRDKKLREQGRKEGREEGVQLGWDRALDMLAARGVPLPDDIGPPPAGDGPVSQVTVDAEGVIHVLQPKGRIRTRRGAGFRPSAQ